MYYFYQCKLCAVIINNSRSCLFIQCDNEVGNVVFLLEIPARCGTVSYKNQLLLTSVFLIQIQFYLNQVLGVLFIYLHIKSKYLYLNCSILEIYKQAPNYIILSTKYGYIFLHLLCIIEMLCSLCKLTHSIIFLVFTSINF